MKQGGPAAIAILLVVEKRKLLTNLYTHFIAQSDDGMLDPIRALVSFMISVDHVTLIKPYGSL